MIPDFPKFKKRFLNASQIYLSYAFPSNTKTIFEGNRFKVQHNEDGWSRESTLQPIGSKGTIENKSGYESYFPFVELVANAYFEMSFKRVALELDEIDKVTKESGRALDGGGREYTPDLFMKYIRFAEFYFDNRGYGYTHILFDRIDGRRYYSTIVINHSNELMFVNFDPKHENLIHDSIKNNSYFKSEIEKIITKQRHLWYDNESNRKLVD